MKPNSSEEEPGEGSLGPEAELLGQAEIFSSLDADELREIAEYSEFQEFENDARVFMQGDPGASLYVVDFGEVVVRKVDESGGSTDIARFVPGTSFGELDMFTESTREAEAVVSCPTRLLVFPKRGTHFTDILGAKPAESARILHRLLVEIATRIRSANALLKENSPLVRELRNQVYRDKLTGLYNRTFLLEKLRDLSREGTSGFALIILKPDNFKDLNDHFGHEAGDGAIRLLGESVRSFVGDDERIARFKGNAMAAVLPGATRDEAARAAEALQARINELNVTSATGGEDFRITSSLGVSLYPDHGTILRDLLDRTHELPLVGRARGGNRILFPEDAS